jgi:uncharacterized membrane protein YdjX (TVP38/TMEM64 family)
MTKATGTEPIEPTIRRRPRLARFVPLLVLVAGFIAFFALGLDRYVSFETLREHRGTLLAWVGAHRLLAVVIYVAVYAAAIATSIPGGLVLSVAGGFLFGTWLGSVCVLVGATAGATAVFLAARTALRDVLAVRAGPYMRRMEAGFRENAFHYLLVLRLVPLFPFWLVNLVPALLGVPLRTYVAATALGIIPGTVVFSSVGNGLGAIFDEGGTPDARIVLRFEVLGPLLGLAALSLLPVAYRKLRAKRAA